MWLSTAVSKSVSEAIAARCTTASAPVHEAGQHVRIAREVGDDHVVTRGHDVDAAHVVAGGNEPGHQTPSDTPGRPGDHNAHVVMLARALEPSACRRGGARAWSSLWVASVVLLGGLIEDVDGVAGRVGQRRRATARHVDRLTDPRQLRVLADEPFDIVDLVERSR